MQHTQVFQELGVRRAARPRIALTWALRGAAVFDMAMLVAAAVAAGAWLRGGGPCVEDLAQGALTAWLFAAMAANSGLFRLERYVGGYRQASSLAFAVTLGVGAPALVFFFAKTSAEHSRAVFALTYAFSLAGVFAGRFASARLLRAAALRGGLSGRPAVIIGEARELARLTEETLLNFGVDALARFDIRAEGGDLGPSDRQTLMRAMQCARQSRAQEFALLVDWEREPALSQVLTLLRDSPLPVRLYPDRRRRDILRRHRGRPIDAYRPVELQRAPLRRSELLAKRAFDVAFAALALIGLSPLLALTAALVRLDSPGPAIFRQRRTGFDGRVFTIFKFRTMTVLEDGERVAQARRDDPRVTRLGALLRRTSLDELPQLWNVLRGDMSLVGPRPHALAHDAEYSRLICEYARRQHVRPGLTGAAQVRGHRGETRTPQHMADRVEWDLWYIDHWSLWLDLGILARTFGALLARDAY
jgi:undecaprenyl-phosphate galactose phosphotransferase/putative colanic acid biosynthesis UDP-glucose lipid carrier transferase